MLIQLLRTITDQSGESDLNLPNGTIVVTEDEVYDETNWWVCKHPTEEMTFPVDKDTEGRPVDELVQRVTLKDGPVVTLRRKSGKDRILASIHHPDDWELQHPFAQATVRGTDELLALLNYWTHN